MTSNNRNSFLTVSDTRSLKASFWQGLPFSEVPGENPSLFLTVSDGFLHSLACGSVAPISVSVFTWSPLLCVWTCTAMFRFLLLRTPVIRFRAHMIPVKPYPNLCPNYIFRDNCFRTRSHSPVLGRHELFNPVHLLIKVYRHPGEELLPLRFTAVLSINLILQLLHCIITFYVFPFLPI